MDGSFAGTLLHASMIKFCNAAVTSCKGDDRDPFLLLIKHFLVFKKSFAPKLSAPKEILPQNSKKTGIADAADRSPGCIIGHRFLGIVRDRIASSFSDVSFSGSGTVHDPAGSRRGISPCLRPPRASQIQGSALAHLDRDFRFRGHADFVFGGNRVLQRSDRHASAISLPPDGRGIRSSDRTSSLV